MSTRTPPIVTHYAWGRIDVDRDPATYYLTRIRSDIRSLTICADHVEITGAGRTYGDLGDPYTWRLQFRTDEPDPAPAFEHTGPDRVGEHGRLRLVRRVLEVLGGIGSLYADGAGPLELDDAELVDRCSPQVVLYRGPILLAVWDTDFGVLVPPCVTLPPEALDRFERYATLPQRVQSDADALMSDLSRILDRTTPKEPAA